MIDLQSACWTELGALAIEERQVLEDNILILQTMGSSKYAAKLMDTIKSWERKLNTVEEHQMTPEEREKFDGARTVEIEKILSNKALRMLSPEETAEVYEKDLVERFGITCREAVGATPLNFKFGNSTTSQG